MVEPCIRRLCKSGLRQMPRAVEESVAGAGDTPGDNYTIVARDDGSRQWAYKGKPLYTFVKDQKGGDITGDGFLNGAWHLAQP
jgi:predicted lipoprotein with Yx(FWY)xxD motif